MRVLALAVPHARVALLLDGQTNVQIVRVVVIPLVRIAVGLIVVQIVVHNAQMGAPQRAITTAGHLALMHVVILAKIIVVFLATILVEVIALIIAGQIAQIIVAIVVATVAAKLVVMRVELCVQMHAQVVLEHVRAPAEAGAQIPAPEAVTGLAEIITVQQFAQMTALPPRIQRLIPHAADVLMFVKTDASLAQLPARRPAALAALTTVMQNVVDAPAVKETAWGRARMVVKMAVEHRAQQDAKTFVQLPAQKRAHRHAGVPVKTHAAVNAKIPAEQGVKPDAVQIVPIIVQPHANRCVGLDVLLHAQ